MKFTFVLENGKRRPLANALGGAMGVEARYLGAPTFCFEIGRCLLDRDGVLDIPEGTDHEALLARLAVAGFRPEQETVMQQEPVQQTSVPGFVIPIPVEDFNARVRDNLNKLLAAKGSLIMAALGVNRLAYTEEDGVLLFDLYDAEPEQRELAACTQLLMALCATAREQVRVTAKAQDNIGNPKYAMRCFLLKLGFIGPEYREARSVLLSRLPGNGSFKSR